MASDDWWAGRGAAQFRTWEGAERKGTEQISRFNGLMGIDRRTQGSKYRRDCVWLVKACEGENEEEDETGNEDEDEDEDANGTHEVSNAAGS